MRHVIVQLQLLCIFSVAQTDSPIPPEVLHKTGYVNLVPKPTNFTSAMLWGIAIADTRVHGYKKSRIEISRMQLTCRVDGRDFALNDDRGQLQGGLYRRYPWFGTDEHDPMPTIYSGTPWKSSARSVLLRVGTRTDRVWHFWAGSSRAAIPAGRLEGCTVKVRARISRGALLQVGFDYWRNSTIGYESGGNNHEAGASDWYLPLDMWQEAMFTDIKN